MGDADADGYIALEPATGEEPAIEYRAPNPPGFSAAHRYIFLVFEQPAGLGGGKEEVRRLLGLQEGEVGL